MATTALRVGRLLHVVIEVAQGNRLVAVPLPPDRKQICERLPPPVAFLRLAHTLGRVVAAKRQQGIANPSAPLCEAAEWKAGLNIGRCPAPPPDRQQGGQ